MDVQAVRDGSLAGVETGDVGRDDESWIPTRLTECDLAGDDWTVCGATVDDGNCVEHASGWALVARALGMDEANHGKEDENWCLHFDSN